jgi:inosose dehydratase
VIASRLAAGPISWGVCEVPGWGLQLPPADVLSQMHAVGIRATEAGPDGYLGTDAAGARQLLQEHELQLVGGFLPLVLHDPDQLPASLGKAETTARLFGELGASVINTAAVVDDAWSAPVALSEREWAHLLDSLPQVDAVAARHGLTQALHPHWGTLVERDDDVRRVVDGSDVRLCLDTGHLRLGGTDGLALAREIADRIAHVHLKDVNDEVARRLRTGEIPLVAAVAEGLFQPLGNGDAPVAEVVLALEEAGYDGWYVLEQDTALAVDDEATRDRPLEDVRRSIAFLTTLALDDAAVASAGEGR